MATAKALVDHLCDALDAALLAGPMAGARGAGDELGALGDALRDGGARVAALASLGRLVDEFRQKGTAAALLDARAAAFRVRGALGDPGACPGEAAALEPAEPIDTPLDTDALADLQRALSNKAAAHARNSVLGDALDRGLLRDLRMLPVWTSALADPSMEALVLERAVPAIGRAIAPAVRAKMPAHHSALAPGDAPRLVALATVDPASAAPYARTALLSHAPTVRLAGMRALGWADPDHVEPVALKLLADPGTTGELRSAAAEALVGSSTEASLAALLKELWRGGHGNPGAEAALRASRSGAVGPRLLAEAKALCASGRTLGNEDRLARARLIVLLGRRRPVAPGVLAFLLARLDRRDPLRDDASRALVSLGEPDGLEAVALRIDEDGWQAIEFALDALLVRDPSTLYDRLAPELVRAAAGDDRRARERACELLAALSRIASSDERYDGSSRAALLEQLRWDPRWGEYARSFGREASVLAKAARDVVDALAGRNRAR